MTFRPKNECDRCGYTWHPRGKDRSLKCPHCGGRDIIKYKQEYDNFEEKLIGFGFLCLIIGGIMFAATHEKEESWYNSALTNVGGITFVVGMGSVALGGSRKN